jgi:hypothetical protein
MTGYIYAVGVHAAFADVKSLRIESESDVPCLTISTKHTVERSQTDTRLTPLPRDITRILFCIRHIATLLITALVLDARQVSCPLAVGENSAPAELMGYSVSLLVCNVYSPSGAIGCDKMTATTIVIRAQDSSSGRSLIWWPRVCRLLCMAAKPKNLRRSSYLLSCRA